MITNNKINVLLIAFFVTGTISSANIDNFATALESISVGLPFTLGKEEIIPGKRERAEAVEKEKAAMATIARRDRLRIERTKAEEQAAAEAEEKVRIEYMKKQKEEAARIATLKREAEERARIEMDREEAARIKRAKAEEKARKKLVEKERKRKKARALIEAKAEKKRIKKEKIAREKAEKERKEKEAAARAERERIERMVPPKKALPAYPQKPKKKDKTSEPKFEQIFNPKTASHDAMLQQIVGKHTKVFSKDEVVKSGISEDEKEEWNELLEEFLEFMESRFTKGSVLGKISDKNKRLFYAARYDMKTLSDYLIRTINMFNTLFFKQSQDDWSKKDSSVFKSRIEGFKEKLSSMDDIEKSLKGKFTDGTETKKMKTLLKNLLKFIKVTYKKILNEKVLEGRFKIGDEKLKLRLAALTISGKAKKEEAGEEIPEKMSRRRMAG